VRPVQLTFVIGASSLPVAVTPQARARLIHSIPALSRAIFRSEWLSVTWCTDVSFDHRCFPIAKLPPRMAIIWFADRCQRWAWAPGRATGGDEAT